ncbi:hypothetical protein OG2516_07972 [Oceanicola granulosus HTCC2516]|uniref:Gcp-like domain-containing protein n=1 Tax=Oceanicola granulosus (strain ATCC BAA-861 / DSM 15982 / KCTC 12143 / HTCC2516) TaxID=314256 RepID=Q2CI60_OCEGH|nr:tRNA (adenosine(37)-N6)-threonylcarbamoyltransferase complex dimerization subunit type 1 TsaB [Oceanicola granulosus]EAR52398.1 hypothetical protein OG2516_07972 [Oceanicola granulosus HTCC2516]
MPTADLRTLVFDTSAAHCAAALSSGGAVLHSAVEPMTRGQAERLIPLIEELQAADGTGWDDIAAIGVGIGPGNFTGIRIAVAAARGLALGLGVPAIGLSSFELARAPEDTPAELVLLEAPRGGAYAQLFAHERPAQPPELIDPSAPPARLARGGLVVSGHRAAEVAAVLGGKVGDAPPGDLPHRLSRLAFWKLRHGYDVGQRPAPLYVRAADAAPPSDPPPVILP